MEHDPVSSSIAKYSWVLPPAFFSAFPWSSAFPGGRRKPPRPEGFKVYTTRSEVSTFLCSAQSPLRAQAVGGTRVPGRPRQKDVNSSVSIHLLGVPIPVLSSPSPQLPLWLRPRWMAEVEFVFSECDAMFPGSHLFSPTATLLQHDLPEIPNLLKNLGGKSP